MTQNHVGIIFHALLRYGVDFMVELFVTKAEPVSRHSRAQDAAMPYHVTRMDDYALLPDNLCSSS